MLSTKETVKIKSISKYGLANTPLKNINGYMGVSICSHFYSKKNVTAIIEWASKTFHTFLFLIADEPQTYTFLSSKGLNFNDSYSKAMMIGDEKFAFIKRLIDTSFYSNIKIVRWQDIAHNTSFLTTRKEIVNCYQNDNNFKNDVLKQVSHRNEILSTADEILQINKYNFDIAAKYVLNEIAVMIYLQEIAENTFPIQVYPSQMPTCLAGLYENMYFSNIGLNREKSGYIEIEVNAA